jgi:hypothetical protein
VARLSYGPRPQTVVLDALAGVAAELLGGGSLPNSSLISR